jgi:predicted metal-dependent hydrolase
MKYVYNNEEYIINVIKKNNKNTYIRVSDDLEINISTNYKTSDRDIKRIIKNNSIAINNMLEKKIKTVKDNDSFKYLGNTYHIVIVPTFKEVVIDNNYIYTNSILELNKWLDKQIVLIFEERYNLILPTFENIPEYRMRVRDMKTRWGVCNKSSKTITLNKKLIRYPIECLDYVIVHELCHLTHFDHSSSFWKLVEKHCPNYKNIKKLLK